MGGMDPLGGKLLVATPRLLDPNFFRAVLLICEHSEAGAIGLVLNRPTTLEVVDHLPAWAPQVTEPAVVFEGGPVQRETAIGLAGSDAGIAIPGWNPVTDRVGMFDLSAENSTDLAHLRVFAGYAGWTGGQLEAEIVTGSWFVFDSTPEDPFLADAESLWTDVLSRQDGSIAMFAHFPDDPSLN